MPANKSPGNGITVQFENMRGSLCFNCQNPNTMKKISTQLHNHFIQPKADEEEYTMRTSPLTYIEENPIGIL